MNAQFYFQIRCPYYRSSIEASNLYRKIYLKSRHCSIYPTAVLTNDVSDLDTQKNKRRHKFKTLYIDFIVV